MNTHLISTALLAVGLDTPVMTDNTNLVVSTHLQVHEQIVQESINMDTSNTFKHGDFTSHSKSMRVNSLYAGDGSSAMTSIRQIRF